MADYNWKTAVYSWAGTSQRTINFGDALIDFFSHSFHNTAYPDISFFGSTKESISLIIGRIYLSAYIRGDSVEDKGIWLLLDRPMQPYEGIEYKVVKSTLKSPKHLFWLHAKNIDCLNIINLDESIWNSFREASKLVAEVSTHGKYTIINEIASKHRLDTFWQPTVDRTPNTSNAASSDTTPLLAEEVLPDTTLYEGAIKQITVNAYERNAKARKLCINYYGYKCQVCTMDFETTYGKIGEKFIHVHHIKPLSDIRNGYQIDPIQDLRPVCPNCHAMLHRNKEVMSIEELRYILRLQREKNQSMEI